MSKNPVPADIETSSDAYAARFAGPVGSWMLAKQEQLVLKMLADRPKTSILDVGGGHAQLAPPLCRKAHPVTVLGSDPSCGSRLAPLIESGSCTFKTGDLLDPPFEDGSFDTVLSVRLLPHCEDWQQLIRQFCRIAKHGVIVDYPTSQSLNKIAPALFGAKKKLEGNTRPFRLFRHDEVVAEFQKNGFSLNWRTGEFFLPMVLHRTLKCRSLSTLLEALPRILCLTRLCGSPVIAHFTRSKKPTTS